MANFFPRWTNALPIQVVVAVGVILLSVTIGVAYYFTPKYTRVGYEPIQPVPFEHSLHVEQLGMDCRYCHSQVEVSYHSNVPATQVCMNCHEQVQKENPKLEVVRQSWKTGEPVPWIWIHHPPDFVYFNHSAHVNRGVSCYSCHGQVNDMKVVRHDKPLSMSWCLDCHRAPEKNLRPLDKITDLNWKPPLAEQREVGQKLKQEWAVNPPTDCAGCHR
jgi:hypothetical protein